LYLMVFHKQLGPQCLLPRSASSHSSPGCSCRPARTRSIRLFRIRNPEAPFRWNLAGVDYGQNERGPRRRSAHRVLDFRAGMSGAGRSSLLRQCLARHHYCGETPTVPEGAGPAAVDKSLGRGRLTSGFSRDRVPLISGGDCFLMSAGALPIELTWLLGVYRINEKFIGMRDSVFCNDNDRLGVPPTRRLFR